MANLQGEQLDQAGKEAQAKLMKSVIDVLRENQNALCYLPDMFEELIEMSEAKAGKASKSGHLYESRSDEEEYKAILEKKEIEDLQRRVTFLTDDNHVKDEMIKSLKENIEDKERHLSALTNTKKAKHWENNRSDSSFGEAKENDEKLMEQAKKHEDLIREVKKKDEELKEKHEKFEQLKQESIGALSSKKKEIDQLKNRHEDLIREVKKKDEELTEKQEKFEQLKQKSIDALSSKEKEIDQLKSRIAFLSDKKVKQDQSKVEDTLSMNRQSKLEEDFSNFIDEARMDAIERIQFFYPSKEEIDVQIYYPRLACLMFEAAYERMKEAKEAITDFFKEMIRGMVDAVPEMSRLFTKFRQSGALSYIVQTTIQVQTKESRFSDVLDALMLVLKETANDFNLDGFDEEVKHIIWGKWKMWLRKETSCRISLQQHLLLDPGVTSYIKQCIRLTWRMVTQVPALEIEYQSSYLRLNIHKKKGYHSGSDMRKKERESAGKNPGEEIACYLWPGLFDGGGSLIRAGEVLCKVKSE